MNVLVVGGGGREHALAWKFRQDPRVTQIWIAPGNAGTSEIGTNVPIAVTEIDKLVAWASENEPDLTFVGPEVPLCLGIVDAFREKGLVIFGPDKNAAQLEGSKAFTKNLLLKYGIPTARAASFTEPLPAYAFSQSLGFPQVIKADGLAAGKGVIIAECPEIAARAIYNILEKGLFGDAGKSVLIEEFLQGEEASVHAVTDGKTFHVFPAAQDHKRVGENDTGPNTGGMGAYAPAPVVTPHMMKQIEQTVFVPLLAAFASEGIDYTGILYAGMMLTPDGPKVLEFNARLGDPETQVLLPLLETPLADIALAAAKRELHTVSPVFRAGSAITVVLAAEGYPSDPRRGDAITNIPEADENGIVFHSGTSRKSGKVVTAGGRVLTATAWGKDLRSAADLAYGRVSQIRFAGAHFRRDIGARAFKK